MDGTKASSTNNSKPAQRRANADPVQSDGSSAGTKKRRTQRAESQRMDGIQHPADFPVANVQQQQHVQHQHVQHQQQEQQNFLNPAQAIQSGAFAVVEHRPQQQQQQTPQQGGPAHIAISYTKPLVLEQQLNEREAIMDRIRRRQLAELALMEKAKPMPEDIADCPEHNAYGLTDVGFLLLGWRENMCLSKLTAVVAQSCAMGGPSAKFKGRKLVLQFDPEASQLLSVKEWDRNDCRPSELARAQQGDRVMLQRLNVTQGKGTTVTTTENTFLFSVTFGQFSVMTIVAHTGNEWTPTGRLNVPGRVLAINAPPGEGKHNAPMAMQHQQQRNGAEADDYEEGDDLALFDDVQEIIDFGTQQQQQPFSATVS